MCKCIGIILQLCVTMTINLLLTVVDVRNNCSDPVSSQVIFSRACVSLIHITHDAYELVIRIDKPALQYTINISSSVTYVFI